VLEEAFPTPRDPALIDAMRNPQLGHREYQPPPDEAPAPIEPPDIFD
jgi:hypothetical protein